MSEREDRKYLESLYLYWNTPSRSPRGRMSLTKTFLVFVIFGVCIALLSHMSLAAFSGLQDTSGQEQTSLTGLQNELDSATPVATQDAPPDQSSASGYWYLPSETSVVCMGQWAPLFIALRAGINARAG